MCKSTYHLIHFMHLFLQDPITNPLPLEESSNFGVDTRDQMESSMEVEEGKIDMPNDKEIPCSSLKLGKPTSCLIGNESCREDTMVSYLLLSSVALLLFFEVASLINFCGVPLQILYFSRN